jgi:hypothetical protein
MNRKNTELNVKNLCSRKLWELIRDEGNNSSLQKNNCEQELLVRNHYISELQQLRQQQSIIH